MSSLVEPSARARRRKTFIAALALFLASRLLIAYAYRTDDTDLKLYAQYALELVYAEKHDVGFYDYHQKYIVAELAAWKKAGGPELPPMVRAVEYPPPAIAWIALPALFIDAPPEDGVIPRSLVEDYKRAYRTVMLLVDLATFLLAAALLHRRHPAAGANIAATATAATTAATATATADKRADATTAAAADKRADVHFAAGLALYIASGAVLYHVVYDRLDLVLGSIVLLAFALLADKKRHLAWSALALAAAIVFKLVPAVLALIWTIAAARREHPEQQAPRASQLAKPAFLLAALTTACVLPFYLASGPPAFAFLGYHEERGLQIESSWASLLMLASFAGHQIEVVQGFGSYNLSSSLAPLFTKLSTYAVVFAVALASLRFYRRPKDALTAALTTLLLAMLAAKVLSPQYLLWLVPLVPVVAPFRAQLAFFAACVLTTAIFPHYYPTDIARLVVGPLMVPELLDPTAFGKLLVIARNSVLAALAVLVSRR